MIAFLFLQGMGKQWGIRAKEIMIDVENEYVVFYMSCTLDSSCCNQVAQSVRHQMPMWESRVRSGNNSNSNSVSADFLQNAETWFY